MKKKLDFLSEEGGLFYHQWNEDSSEIEVGYRALKQHWGKGYQTEILRGRLHYGFNTLQKKELCAVVFPGNHISAHVIKKCGGQYVGITTYFNKYKVEKYIFKNNHSESSI